MKILIRTIAIITIGSLCWTASHAADEIPLGGGGVQNPAPAASAYRDMKAEILERFLRAEASRKPQTPPLLLVASGQIDSDKVARIYEDIAIMSHIIQKSLASQQDKGLELTQALFLEDYGTLFEVKSPFPLAPPPGKPQAEEGRTEEDRTWQETKQELYTATQPPSTRGRGRMYQFDIFGEPSAPQPAKYDEARIESLKKSLIESLKYASNIRDLQADAWIILAVNTAERGPKVVRIPTMTPDNSGFLMMGYGEPEIESSPVMTIRVKKVVADALAEGKIDFEEFRKSVQVLIY